MVAVEFVIAGDTVCGTPVIFFREMDRMNSNQRRELVVKSTDDLVHATSRTTVLQVVPVLVHGTDEMN